MIRSILSLGLVVLFFASSCFAQSEAVHSTESVRSSDNVASNYPLFIADLPNPNDFSLFANGGWDGNWYVGFNTCWMQKLTVPKGKYRRAYIGAKLGRMKNFQAAKKTPWEKKSFPGKIYIAISSTPSWKRAQSFFLCNTRDIPLEPDFENAVEGVGESRWFWAKIPMKFIQPGKDHYLAVWSPSPRLNNVSSAPILAAGWGNKEVNSWVSHDIKGLPPTKPSKALSTPITVFEPAIAIKLVPRPIDSYHSSDPGEKPFVEITRVVDGKSRGRTPAPKSVCSAVRGESIQRSWIEVSADKKKWGRYGRYVWNTPYCFTLKTNEVPIGKDGRTWVRVVAQDIFERKGESLPVSLFETH